MVLRAFGGMGLAAGEDAVTELKEGWFNVAYNVKLADGREVVLKIAPPQDVEVMSYEKNIMYTEVTAMRFWPFARDDALDRIGAGLGVPRLTDTIRFVPPESLDWPAIFGEFAFGERRFGGGSPGEIRSERRRELDEEYRLRLAIYRPFAVPNRRTVIERLNGFGAQTEPEMSFDLESNSGLLRKLGFEHRFRVVESDKV